LTNRDLLFGLLSFLDGLHICDSIDLDAEQFSKHITVQFGIVSTDACVIAAWFSQACMIYQSLMNSFVMTVYHGVREETVLPCNI
jgi:hypothetical protein